MGRFFANFAYPLRPLRLRIHRGGRKDLRKGRKETKQHPEFVNRCGGLVTQGVHKGHKGYNTFKWKPYR
jgi:hypothetical protein